MAKGYMYILKCSNDSYYTGSTKDLDRRLKQHQAGEGANHTKKHLPVELIYFEEFERIDWAFNREKQVQGWGRKKKEALISGDFESLSPLSIAYRDKGRDFERLSPLSRALTPSIKNSKNTLSKHPMPEALEGSGGNRTTRKYSREL